MTCPRCGTIAPDGAERCGRCRADLAVSADRPDFPIPVVRAPTRRGEAAQRAAGVIPQRLAKPAPPRVPLPSAPPHAAGGEPVGEGAPPPPAHWPVPVPPPSPSPSWLPPALAAPAAPRPSSRWDPPDPSHWRPGSPPANGPRPADPTVAGMPAAPANAPTTSQPAAVHPAVAGDANEMPALVTSVEPPPFRFAVPPPPPVTAAAPADPTTVLDRTAAFPRPTGSQDVAFAHPAGFGDPSSPEGAEAPAAVAGPEPQLSGGDRGAVEEGHQLTSPRMGGWASREDEHPAPRGSDNRRRGEDDNPRPALDAPWPPPPGPWSGRRAGGS